MYSGGENLQMNGDTPHDGGHGGGGHGDCEELQRTGRSVTRRSAGWIWWDPSKVATPFHPFPFPSHHTVCIGRAVTPSTCPGVFSARLEAVRRVLGTQPQQITTSLK